MNWRACRSPHIIVLALPLSELKLISRVRRIATAGRSRSRATTGVIAGIGDDSAVLRIPAGHEALVTTDFSIENVHFRRSWHSPESIGHRCLVRGLSDIAAMGGEPIAAFLSLAIPSKIAQSWVDRFLRGLLKLASQFNVTLAGGDTAESPNGILADIVVVGCIPKGKAILRSRARPGDRIYVTGELGGAAAALNVLYERPKKKLTPQQFPKTFFPTPRIDIGRVLRDKKIATAMIDISDGLSTDLAHMCDESGVGAELWKEAIPRANVGSPPRKVNLEFALNGGDEYELLFTARPKTRVPDQIAGVSITEIGRIQRGRHRNFRPRGWQHFQHPSRG